MKHLMKKLKVLLAMLSERNEMERVHRVTLSFKFSASQITEGVVKNHNSPNPVFVFQSMREETSERMSFLLYRINFLSRNL